MPACCPRVTVSTSGRAVYDEYPIVWAVATTKEDPNQLYNLPGVSITMADLYLWTDMYRYDWIKQLGIDIGEVEQIGDRLYVAKDAVKLSTYKEILEGFASMGNNVIPATWNGTTAQQQHLSAFGVIKGYMNENGTGNMYYATEGYKEYLKYFADLYSKGLVDKEFLTQDRTVWWEKVNTNVSGYFVSSSNSINIWANQRPPMSLLTQNPEAEIVETPGLADENGNYISTNGSAVPLCNGSYFYINSKVTDDATVARMLKFIEFAHYSASPDELKSFWYGEKDVDWKDDPDRPGYPLNINALDTGAKGTSYFNLMMQTGDAWNWLTMEPAFEKGAGYYVKNSGGVWNEHLQPYYREDFMNETDLSAVKKEYDSNITTVIEEFHSNVLIGKVDVDAAWDQYLADLDTAGYQKVRDEYEKAPIVEEVIKQYQ